MYLHCVGVDGPTVILVVGVNGSGKTTSIAKLGKRYKEGGYTVAFAAADTYRAAAVEQLQTWGERLGIRVVSGQMGGDPPQQALRGRGQAVNVRVLQLDSRPSAREPTLRRIRA